ncbi:MAG: helix-turn-helix domain-containing protein [Litorimonas sp.]
MSLALRLKTTRKKHGLSQSELAKLVEVSQPTIANWERGGHIPRPDALSRIAETLNIDTTWLLSGELPARHDPANLYLAMTVRHIPVYEWPLGTKTPTETHPTRYIAMATTDGADLFALEAHVSTGFAKGSSLIFSRSNKNSPGRFLIQTAEGFDLTDDTSFVDNVFARLVYSVVPH